MWACICRMGGSLHAARWISLIILSQSSRTLRLQWAMWGSQLGAAWKRDFSIAEAAGLLMVSFTLSAVLGAIQQFMINAEFGAGAEASAFFAAMRLRDVFFSMLAGRALSSAVIPVLASLGRPDRREAHARLLNLVLTALLAGLVVVVLACEVLAPFIVSVVLAPGFDDATRDLSVALIRIVLLQPLFVAVASVGIAFLNSRHRFLLASLSLVCHNVGLIAGIEATRIQPALGVMGPAAGVVVGAALQILFLVPELRSEDFRWRAAWDPADAHLREVGRLLLPISCSACLPYIGLVLDTAFASVATEVAALPAVYNAWLLVTLPQSLIGKALGQSAFPRTAQSVADGDWVRVRGLLFRTVGAAIGLALPAAVALIALGRTTIGVLFEHGRFDASAADLTYKVVAVYAVALPGAIATEILTRGLLAMRNTRMPLFTDLAQVLGRAGLMVVLVPRLGVVAIPFAFAATTLLEAGVLACALLMGLRDLRSPIQPQSSLAMVE
jgi:putative peptidoglycan lipid II flippase